MIKQKIGEKSLVYKPRHHRDNTSLYSVIKHNKEDKSDYPFYVSTPEGNYYFNEDGVSSSGNRIVFLANPENKKLLEDLFLIEFEAYEDSCFYKNIKKTFSDLIILTERLSEVSFNKELSEELKTLYSKYYKD